MGDSGRGEREREKESPAGAISYVYLKESLALSTLLYPTDVPEINGESWISKNVGVSV